MEVMVKTRFTIILLALALCVSYGNGQDDQASSRLHIDSTVAKPENRGGSSSITLGIGVSVGFGLLQPNREASISFPIIAGRNFRIEPELGIFRRADDEYSYSKLGVGLFYVLPLRLLNQGYFKDIPLIGLLDVVPLGGYSAVYFGPRIASLTGEFPERKGYLTALSAGLELGSPHFTLGLELWLDYSSVKRYNEFISGNGIPVRSHDVITHSALGGEAHLILRAYL